MEGEGIHLIKYKRGCNRENNQYAPAPVKGPTYRVACIDDINFSMSIKDGKVILAKANPNDDYQHWYKDDKHGSTVKDAFGNPAFSLINKVTGQVIKKPLELGQPLLLAPYNASDLDKTVLWGWNATRNGPFAILNVMEDAYSLKYDFTADGGAKDGVQIIARSWIKSDPDDRSQQWIINPY